MSGRHVFRMSAVAGFIGIAAFSLSDSFKKMADNLLTPGHVSVPYKRFSVLDNKHWEPNHRFELDKKHDDPNQRNKHEDPNHRFKFDNEHGDKKHYPPLPSRPERPSGPAWPAPDLINI